MSWAEGLSADQCDVVETPVQHARVLAGPGTGKTHGLVRRAEFLLQVLPEQATLLALTFTRAAAAEMRDRLAERLGLDAERVKVSTLHAYALAQLMVNDTTYLPRPLRIVGDWEERHVVVEELKHLSSYRTVKEVEKALQALGNDWDTLQADLQTWDERSASPVFYGAWINHRSVYGYTLRSELVYQLLQELRADPGLAPRVQPSAILVDEYQDLNHCELTTVRELAERLDATVFAVGDDDQSIYSFRHAAPAGIRDFAGDYPDAADLRLSECWRCGPKVVDLATRVIGQEHGRAAKTLVSTSGADDQIDLVRFDDQQDEALGLAQLIDSEIEAGTPPEQILVLFKKDRSGAVSRELDEQLFSLGHSAHRPRVQDDEDLDLVRLEQYLQLAVALAAGEVDHLSLRGLLQLEPNGVGSTTLLRVLDLAIDRGVRFADALELLRVDKSIGLHGRDRLIGAADAIYTKARELAPLEGETLEAYVDRAALALGIDEDALAPLRTALDGRKPAPELDDLAPAADAEHLQDLLSALHRLADVVPAAVEGLVTLTTMHGAKGLTADVVIVCQLEDEAMPGPELNQAEADEQRRLLYVSITRARRRLVLTYCAARTGAQGFGTGFTLSARQDITRFLRGEKLRATTIARLLP